MRKETLCRIIIIMMIQVTATQLQMLQLRYVCVIVSMCLHSKHICSPHI
jgi:hypothetical protein